MNVEILIAGDINHLIIGKLITCRKVKG